MVAYHFDSARIFLTLWSAYYQVGQWGHCKTVDSACVKTRDVTCVTPADAILTTCDGLPIPDATSSCGTLECPSYSWSTGEWSSCPVTCGSSKRVRSVKCVKSSTQGSEDVEDSYCPAPKPQTEQVCYGECDGTQGCCRSKQHLIIPFMFDRL